MGENSKIEWCDHTWNPWRGCAWATLPDGSQHPGCDHCYAAAMSKRNHKTLGEWGTNGTRIVAVDKTFNAPIKWNAQAQKEGVRKRVFVNSLSDFFEDWSGPMCDPYGKHLVHGHNQWLPEISEELESASRVTMQDVRNRAFTVIDRCPWLDFLLLTKRPQNIRRMWNRMQCDNCIEVSCGPHRTGCLDLNYRSNVWLMTSVSNQETADEMILELLQCRDLSPVLGISAEPLLGSIQLQPVIRDGKFENHLGINLDWIIVGGESGPGARTMHPDWVRSIRDQCHDAGVPLFVKQMGGKRKPFPEIPDDMFIRQFPKAAKGDE